MTDTPSDRASVASSAGEAREITFGRVAAIALPVVLSNATVPLQGAIDTAIIGNLGSEVYLAAVALGASLFSVIVGTFNFLQMGSSGLAAQALGAAEFGRVVNVLLRALIAALAIAAILFALQVPLIAIGLRFFEGSPGTEELAASYLHIRLFGLPAELGNYVLLGWFAGQEMTRRLFEMQIVLSLVNIALNLLFVLGLGWGVEGVALGTALAAYAGLGYGLFRAWQRSQGIRPESWRLEAGRLFRGAELVQMLTLNRDIFIRSIMLMFCFAWFTRLGSMQGDIVLAANGILVLFLHIAAYSLDGFAMAAETLVGQALGMRSVRQLRRAVTVSTSAAFALAVAYSVLASLFAGPLVDLFTNVPEVQSVALEHALWATAVPIVGVFAFQMDGIFIGAADGPGMRNAMIYSAVIYVPLSWAMEAAWGNDGIWASVWLFMLIRAGFLMARFPAVQARAEAGSR